MLTSSDTTTLAKRIFKEEIYHLFPVTDMASTWMPGKRLKAKANVG